MRTFVKIFHSNNDPEELETLKIAKKEKWSLKK